MDIVTNASVLKKVLSAIAISGESQGDNIISTILV